MRALRRAVWIGVLCMPLAMLAAFGVALAAVRLDPTCGVNHSGGCATGLVGVTPAAALPGFAGRRTQALRPRRPQLPTVR